MKSEMDILRMDEKQRISWLQANRALLMLVGITWLCMIIWSMAKSDIPYFLIIMVPVFALIRFLFYLYYSRK